MLSAAIENNVGWCELITGRAGAVPQRTETQWWTTDPTPAYYPNLITRAAGLRWDDLADVIETIDASAGPAWGLKDSFGDVDLAHHGFELLFDATWILATELGPPTTTVVYDPPEPSTTTLVRLPELAAGAITFVHGGVVSISNVFGDPIDPVVFASLASVTRGRNPGLPIVGYEHGADLEAARDAGFRSIGPLRVWQRVE